MPYHPYANAGVQPRSYGGLVKSLATAGLTAVINKYARKGNLRSLRSAKFKRMYSGKRKRAARTIQKAARGYLRTAGYYHGSSGNNELKFVDSYNAFSVASGIGTVTDFTDPIETGTTESKRIGRQITIKKIMLKGFIELDASTHPQSTGWFRLMVILDTQTNGLRANTGDIWHDTATSGLLTYNNLSNKYRFKTLLDKTMTINASCYDSVASEYGLVTRHFSYFKALSLPIEYSDGGTGAITEIRTNNIYIITVSAGTGMTVYMNRRTRFSDGR